MNWLDECRVAAESLSQETRQKFMDLIWQGKTLGDAQREAGISFDAANGIVRMNIEEVSYLRKESK
jgi:hypothetical protein